MTKPANILSALMATACITLNQPARAQAVDPKLGKVTMFELPPLTETPGIAGVPLVPVPAPPEPGYGEIPPRAAGSDPGPAPSLPAP